MSKFVRNVEGAKSAFRLQGENIRKFVKEQVEIVGRKGELEAKQKAPIDLGKLRQGIFYESTNNGYGARLTANVNYAAYVEFGTGGKIQVPFGFDRMAKEFKGGNVKVINMKAQPYLIPSAKNAFVDLQRRLKKKMK